MRLQIYQQPCNAYNFSYMPLHAPFMPLSLQELDAKIADVSSVPETPEQKAPEVLALKIHGGLDGTKASQ